ncbi:MAG: hypothetical protein LBU85_12995 [Treponema sp.]|jgi:hypothetical protein|nr:hypothetical protein [Treponema sp.]
MIKFPHEQREKRQNNVQVLRTASGISDTPSAEELIPKDHPVRLASEAIDERG